MNGFLRAPKTGTVALSYTSESYDEFWRGDTKVSTPGGLGQVDTQSLSLWFAWGFTERLTLFGNAAYVDTEGDGTMGFQESDLQDLTLVVGYRLASFGHDRHSLVGAAGVRTPMSNYVTDAPVAVGDGTTDGLLRLIYQFHLPNFYVSQQIGYDLRSGDAPDGYPLFTEVGGTVGRVTLSASYALLFADDGLDIGGPGFVDQFPDLQEEYERVVGKVYVRIGSGFGLSGAYYTTLDGRNTGNSSGGSLGLVYDF